MLLPSLSCVASLSPQSGNLQRHRTQQPSKPPNRMTFPSPIAESVSGTLQFAEGNSLGLAEAMPEDKYPSVGKFDRVRSFEEQVKHVACAQFAFFNEFEGKKRPEDCEKGGHDPAKTKAELINYLNDSFDYSNRVLATLTPCCGGSQRKRGVADEMEGC